MTKAISKKTLDVANTTLPIEIAGSGRPLLFLNGADAFHRSREWTDTVAQHFSIYAPKYPRFGGVKPADHIRNVGHLALLCRELLEALDLRDTVVVGASFGGWVALELAICSCDRISNLVLIDAVGLKFGDAADAEIADIYTLRPEEVRARRYHLPDRIPDYSTFAQDDLVGIAEDWAGEAFYGWRPYMHTPHLKDWLWRVKVPTLVLWGENDGIVPPAYGRRLAAEIPAATFDVIEQAGHYPHVEQPRATFEKMEAFLKEARA